MPNSVPRSGQIDRDDLRRKAQHPLLAKFTLADADVLLWQVAEPNPLLFATCRLTNKKSD